MIHVRRSKDRGHAQHGWLEAYHTFSFGEYFNQDFMGFQSLRVINEDRVQPGQGFPTHSHRDMEIITYILEGSLEHKDSMKNGSVIRAGDVQYMSAGKGVTHSEFNPSKEEMVHLLQIWILPNGRGLEPRYAQKNFSTEQKSGRFRLIASPNGAEDSIAIRQDAKIFATVMKSGAGATYELMRNRHAWIQVAKGSITLNGKDLGQGDGAAVSDEKVLHFGGGTAGAEVLLFDLA